jgi:hypothetical protein
MSTNLDAILGRLKKLLALSKSSNEHEAALAAQRAAELMREYDLSEAQIRVDDPTATAEPIVTAGEYGGAQAKRNAKWKTHLISAAARLHNCRMYYTHDINGRCIRLFGRKSAVAATGYTGDYLVNEVDRLAKAAWVKSAEKALGAVPARSWMDSFRLGAAVTIWQRCVEHANKLLADLEAVKPGGPCTALAVVQSDALAVNDAYRAFSRRFNKARNTSTRISSQGAYAQGSEAGRSVGLSGGRGLGSGPAGALR